MPGDSVTKKMVGLLALEKFTKGRRRRKTTDWSKKLRIKHDFSIVNWCWYFTFSLHVGNILHFCFDEWKGQRF